MNQSSSINNQLSSIIDQQSTINNHNHLHFFFIIFLYFDSQPKIADSNIHFFIEKKIAKFYISVNDFVFMNAADSLYGLVNVITYFWLC